MCMICASLTASQAFARSFSATDSATPRPRRLLENRESDQPPARPLRYRQLAESCLRESRISIGQFASYMCIGRNKAMRQAG